MRTFLLLIVVSLCSHVAIAADTAPDFSKQVAPILNKYCAGCHNDQDRDGKLSLSSFASLLKGGEHGAVVTPGSGDSSRLLRVLTGKAEPKMPPKDNEVPKPAELAILKAWIDAGAKGPAGATADPTLLITPKIPLKAPPRDAIHAAAISPRGNLLATARHGEVELFSLPERKLLVELKGHRGSVNALAFSADGNWLAAAAGEPSLFGEVRLWHVPAMLATAGDTKETPRTPSKIFQGHKDAIYAVRLSPNGQRLATGGYDQKIKLWNIATGKEERTLDGHNGSIFDLSFRRDGQVLASASGDRTVKLWNVATGERLDTLNQSLQELYTVSFSPDGKRVVAAGVDNRIRVWTVSESAREGTNPLVMSQFAHESPVLRVAFSDDGQTLVSAGEDRLVKVWDAASMTIRDTFVRQSDWVVALAIAPNNQSLYVGRLDGSVQNYELKASAASATDGVATPLDDVPRIVDYGPQPPLDKLPQAAEREPNDAPAQATPLTLPSVTSGAIAGNQADVDLFRIDVRAGEQWIFEIDAARSSSPLDSKLEILTADGLPLPRLLLRAIRDSEIEFRSTNSEQRGMRLKNWEEMLLNELIYINGEVIKHFQQRRGPDADSQFYPENGNRITFFETSPRAHALGQPCYVVVPYPLGTKLPNNGLPVFTLFHENDDDARRKLGKDSRLTFTAPHDGAFLVRVTDVRGFRGEKFSYKLVARRPVPDFKVTLTGESVSLAAGSGKQFTVKADRSDDFHGPIHVHLENVPAGLAITSPIVIQAGLFEAQGVINALPNTIAPSEAAVKEIKVTARAELFGREVNHAVNGFSSIKLTEKPKLLAYLEIDPASAGSSVPAVPATEPLDFPQPPQVTIAPGKRTTCRLRIERHGFAGRVQFDVNNLPHGVIVDDIGLSGVLIPEGKTERTIFLACEPWVPETTRLFHAVAKVEGEQVTLPMVLHVRRE